MKSSSFSLLFLSLIAVVNCQPPNVNVQPQNFLNHPLSMIPPQIQQQQFAQQPALSSSALPASPPYHPLFPLSLPLPLWNPLYGPLYPHQTGGWQQLGWQQPSQQLQPAAPQAPLVYQQNQLGGSGPVQPVTSTQTTTEQTTPSIEQTTKAPVGLSNISATELNAAREQAESVSFNGRVPEDATVPRRALGAVQVRAEPSSDALTVVKSVDEHDTTSKIVSMNAVSSLKAEHEDSGKELKREKEEKETRKVKKHKRRRNYTPATARTEQTSSPASPTVIPSVPRVIDYRAMLEARKIAINEQSPSSKRPYTLVERVDLSNDNSQVFEGDDGRLFSLRLKDQETDAVNQILTRVLDAVLPMHSIAAASAESQTGSPPRDSTTLPTSSS